jgi:hypothetical protein
LEEELHPLADSVSLPDGFLGSTSRHAAPSALAFGIRVITIDLGITLIPMIAGRLVVFKPRVARWAF